MEVVLKSLKFNLYNIFRFFYLSHPSGHNNFSDLDEIINQKENFIDYIKYEFFFSIIYNIFTSIPSIIFILFNYSALYPHDTSSCVWISLVSIIKILQIIPKSVILHQVYKISSQIDIDPIISSRRIMYMTRSNIYFYNCCLNYCQLFFYLVYLMLKKYLAISELNTIENEFQLRQLKRFHNILLLLIIGFFSKLVLSFLNYLTHFKVGINEADIQNSQMYMDYSLRATTDLINKINTIVLDQDSLSDLLKKSNCEDDSTLSCCICLDSLSLGNSVKVLPCSAIHVFHKKCIDTWLNRNKICPTCRSEVVDKQRLTSSKTF